MTPGLFIGIDIGTSSVRCTAIDENRQIIATSKQDLPLPENPQAGWFEQDPESWWSATQTSLQQLLQKIAVARVKAISIDGTSSTVLLIDEDNQPVSKGLMYNDSRSSIVIDQLEQFVAEGNITLSASSSLAKAVYLLESSSNDSARYIAHQADWISSKLSGKTAVSDESNCLKLGYDSINRKWPEWLQNAPFDVYKKLPSVFPTGSRVGNIEPGMAEVFKLPAETAVIAGTTDSTASTLATGINDLGQAVTTYGSTLVMKVIAGSPVTSVKDGVYSHRLPGGRWLVGGASNSGGNVLLKYFSVEQIQKLSMQMKPENDTGLNYYPLAGKGERFPENNPGKLPRLYPRPESDAEFLQGIFEGFAMIEKLAYEKMAELGAPMPTEILSAGGQATENQALTEIRSRVLAMPILKAVHTEASYGSALIALNAI